MAAIHGDVITEGEPEELHLLDEVLMRLVVVKVLDRSSGARRVPEEAHRLNLKDRASSGWKTRNNLLRSSEVVPRFGAFRAARISGEATPKRWTSWQRWRRSCVSKMQASASACPVGDSTYSSV